MQEESHNARQIPLTLHEVHERLAAIAATPETHPLYCKPSSGCLDVVQPEHRGFTTAWQTGHDDVEFTLTPTRTDHCEVVVMGRVAGVDEATLTVHNTGSGTGGTVEVRLDLADLDELLRNLHRRRDVMTREPFDLAREDFSRVEQAGVEL